MKNKLTFQWIDKNTGVVEHRINCWTVDSHSYKGKITVSAWYTDENGKTKRSDFEMDDKHWFNVLG